MSAPVPALVIGGGISGLVCAYELQKVGIDTQVVEASAFPGGIIRSQRRDGYLIELGPQSFNATPEIVSLCRELDIEKELIEAPRRAPRFVLVGGRLQQVPLSPRAFFTSPLFNAKTKWSVLRDVLGRSTPPEKDESVADFVRRKFSGELLETLVGPFVSGIYAGDPEHLSLRGAFPRLYDAEASAGSAIRGMMRGAKSKEGPRQRPTLCSFREGNETLIRALANKLGSNLRSSVKPISIQYGGAGTGPRGPRFVVDVESSSGKEIIIADRLALATPTNAAAALMENLNAESAKTLREIEYAPVGVVSAGYRKNSIGHLLTGFGFLVPRSAGIQILGTVWNSSLFAGRAPNEHVLMTTFIGGATNPQAAKLSSEELVSIIHKENAAILDIHEPPTFSNVEIYERAIPQYNLGHTSRMDALNRALLYHSNLKLVGNYLNGPAVGACVEQAQRAARELVKK